MKRAMSVVIITALCFQIFGVSTYAAGFNKGSITVSVGAVKSNYLIEKDSDGKLIKTCMNQIDDIALQTEMRKNLVSLQSGNTVLPVGTVIALSDTALVFYKEFNLSNTAMTKSDILKFADLIGSLRVGKGQISVYLPKGSVVSINSEICRVETDMKIFISGLSNITFGSIASDAGSKAISDIITQAMMGNNIKINISFLSGDATTSDENVEDEINDDKENESNEEKMTEKLVLGVKNTKLNINCRVKKGSIIIGWSKAPGYKVDGYEVYRSTKRNSGYGNKPCYTTKKCTYKNTKDVVTGKTYYYKVRGYRVLEGKRIYTSWSPRICGKAR